MKMIRWAAVVVTALFVLMNLGAIGGSDLQTWVRVTAGVLVPAGAIAATGLALNTSWGRSAVLVVGGLNVAAGLAAVAADQAGGAVGIVVGGLAVVLAALLNQAGPARAHA